MASTVTAFVDQARTGELWFDPQAAIEGHKAILEWISTLQTLYDESAECAYVSGFPTFRDAQQLAEKFVGLATGAKGIQRRLTQFSDVALEIAELFRLSIAKFADTDLAFADYLASLEKPHTSIKDVGHGLTSSR